MLAWRTFNCTAGRVQRYLQRLSGPVAERFALHLETATAEAAGAPRVPALHTIRERVALTRDWLSTQPTVQTSSEANHIFQQHARTFNTSTRGLSHLHMVARLHAAWEQRTGSEVIEIGREDAAFASQMRIFDRPRWWEKPEMP